MSEHDNVRAFFRGIGPVKRDRWKANYERLIAIEKDEYTPPVNPINGRSVKPTKMPHMLPSWEAGLSIVNEVIEECDRPKTA